MDMLQTNRQMEGWLYSIRQNRLGLQFSRKRYFFLRDNCLRSYKSIPQNDNEEPDRRATLDSCIRVTDNGRESVSRKDFFIFTLYNPSNPSDQLKLGASSPEEAAKWIRSLQDVILKGSPYPTCDFVSRSKKDFMRLSAPTRSGRKNSVDWTTSSSLQPEAMASDVIAPSPWKIFGCQNGLRLFKEAKDRESGERCWDDHPAIMAVGVIDATSEDIFNTLMSLGPKRSEWDFCFFRGSVVEHLDGHTDIIHMQLYSDWLPWGMKRRDLLLQRYWRREDDGTYGGGFVVSPVNRGKQSLVKHMLAVDWRYWRMHMRASSGRSITIRMLETVAALRELFRAKPGTCLSDFPSGELIGNKTSSETKMKDVGPETKGPEEIKNTELISLVPEEEIKNTELISLAPEEESKNTDLISFVSGEETKNSELIPLLPHEVEKLSSARTSLMGLNDAFDEFFDVPEANDFDPFRNGWSSPCEISLQTHNQLKLPSAAGLVKKLQDFKVQKKGYMDLHEVAMDDNKTYFYGATLEEDPSLTLPCTWAAADPSTFLIRGQDYLKDQQKVKAKGTLMQMVGADWISSNKREDDLGSRPGGIVQESAAQGGPEFFFIINIQVPGSSMHNLAMYYMLKTPLEDHPLLHSFVNGDDAHRNSRFKLIPHISKGSWIVKQSVGKKACLVGQALEVRYFRGKNYLELDVDVGSSTVARGVTNLVLGYLNNLVIEMAFLIQGNTQAELPEVLLGTCRLNNLDASKSVQDK